MVERRVEFAIGATGDRCRPGGGCDEAQEHAERGGLSGPVGAEEASDGALRHIEGEVVDGEYVAEPLGQAAHGDGGHGVTVRFQAGAHIEGGSAGTVAAAVVTAA